MEDKKDKSKVTTFNKLIIIWIITIFFDSYYVFKIGNTPITIFTIFSFVVLLYSILIISTNRKEKLDFSNVIGVIIIIYLIFNYIITGMQNIKSMFLTIYFFTLFIITNMVEKREINRLYIKVFSICMNIIAIYGIYQFIGRIFNLPFSDIIIENHMVEGYNWSNIINISGKMFYRSNAIFREPSFFSQYLAINIILLFSNILTHNYKKVFSIIMLILNAIALIISFSGTGIIVLAIGGLLYILRLKKSKSTTKKIIIIGVILFICFIIMLNSSIGKYFLIRTTELSSYDENNFSGYVRFIGGVEILKKAWSQDFLFGTGIGTVDEFINLVTNYNFNMSNGFYKPAIELGLIGITLWLIFIFSLFIKKDSNNYVLVIQSTILPLMICHEAFLSNYYWILIYILNFIMIEDNNKNNKQLISDGEFNGEK